MSKPWLEVGPDPVGGPDATGMPTEKIALGVFLAVVGALFALFASAYFMRMEFVDWRPMPVPRIVWLNTGPAGAREHRAAVRARRGAPRRHRHGAARPRHRRRSRRSASSPASSPPGASSPRAATSLTGNPANSFFYLLTGAARPAPPRRPRRARPRRCRRPGADGRDRRALRLRVELCAMYWHFLLLVWLGLLAALHRPGERVRRHLPPAPDLRRPAMAEITPALPARPRPRPARHRRRLVLRPARLQGACPGRRR